MFDYEIRMGLWSGAEKIGEETLICSGQTEQEKGDWIYEWAREYTNKMGYEYSWNNDVEYAVYYKLCGKWTKVCQMWGSEI